MAKGPTPGSAVSDFLERHQLTSEGLDRLFGSTSKGRNCRRWEAEGAPHYVAILMAYADAYGIVKMEEMAARRELISA